MDECSNHIYDETGGNSDMGQSDSKGARKRSGAGSRGASSSFGFRKKTPKGGAAASTDSNGNGGSTEELFPGPDALSGRSTPLARPRKEAAGQPLRTNRFGFRQSTTPKTAKVGDINMSAEQVISANYREQETKNNNFITDKPTTKNNTVTFGLIPTQVGANGISGIQNIPKQTKQTVILTYSAKQYPVVKGPGPALRSKSPGIPARVVPPAGPPRSASASRALPGTRFTTQTNQLPRTQYPALKLLDTKSAKQVVNNSRKVYGSSDGSSIEGSVTEDSGVGMGGEGAEGEGEGWSPGATRRQHRRPRALEMVMSGTHNFHLRELQLNDLDIMDEAIVTDVDVIPLPKLPSTFGNDKRYDTSSGYMSSANRFSRLQTGMASTSTDNRENRTQASNIENYRNRERMRLSDEDLEEFIGEEKACRDRTEKEEKQDYPKINSTRTHSPLTRNSSKESSPSTKSDESHVSSAASDPLEAWVSQTAGESMALRSHDDISVALSLSSSCDDGKGLKKSSNAPSFTPTTVTIVNNEPKDYAKLSGHSMMMNSLTLSQNSALQSMFMSSSMSSSAYSAGSNVHNNLMMEDPKLALAALALSSQSLIDDETSPADSLISSSTDSNNDMPVLEKDTTASTSAYHTADNRTLATFNKEDIETPEDESKEKDVNEKITPPNKSPNSPGTPTNASNSLSLSEGRDFLIDDEIADQPGLIFENNSTADQGTSSLQLIHLNITDSTPTLQDPSNVTSNHRAKGLSQLQRVQSSPVRPRRSPSLDTLSPCDSIASDDLIMDMDMHHSITSLNSVDEYIDRLDGSIRSGLNSLEDSQLREELMKLSVRKQKPQPINSDVSIFGTPIKLQGPSAGSSNSSIANIGASMPARTARLLGRSRAGTPGTGSGTPGTPDTREGAEELRVERATHHGMQQDVLAIRAMLLRLKRILQEPDQGNNMMRTETLNPLELQRDTTLCLLKNGTSLGLAGEGLGDATPPSPHEEVADLRRQLVFLQSQLEDRERMVKLLQNQMSKYSEANSHNDSSRCNGFANGGDDTCNVATQTERLRPVSQGPNLLQSLNSDHTGGLVSWNEQKKPRKLMSPCDFHQPSSSSTPRMKKQVFSLSDSPSSSDIESTATPVSSRTNGHHPANGHGNYDTSLTDGSVHVKASCRVGSRYLQAIASKQSSIRNNVNKDTIQNDRSVRSRSLYSSRSKSIENFHNQSLCNNNATNGYKLNYKKLDAPQSNCSKLKQSGNRDRSVKHHTSYTNIFNGLVNGEQECDYVETNGNSHSGKNGYTNGNVTDTDENSDGGYKSLPPTINLLNHTKVSGIPRRTLNSELRFSAKQAQTNKC